MSARGVRSFGRSSLAAASPIKTRRLRRPRAPATRRSAPRRNMREIESGRARDAAVSATRTWGGTRKGAGRKPRGRSSMPHITRPKIDPRYRCRSPRATPGLLLLRSPVVRRAAACHRAGVGRWLSGDPFLDPAGSRSLYRRGDSAPPRGGMAGSHRLALAVNRCSACASFRRAPTRGARRAGLVLLLRPACAACSPGSGLFGGARRGPVSRYGCLLWRAAARAGGFAVAAGGSARPLSAVCAPARALPARVASED